MSVYYVELAFVFKLEIVCMIAIQLHQTFLIINFSHILH